MTALDRRVATGGGPGPALKAVRARLALITLLLVVAAAGWWWTAVRMRGMDNGPWTALGSLGWFVGVWVVMTAAMMFPSVAPTVALYSRMTKSRSRVSPPLFVAGYLVTWTAAGLVAYGTAVVVGALGGGVLDWDRAGRWAAAGTLVVAALYQLTPFKDVCLGRCRSPLGFLLGSWRDGPLGALRMGAKNGAWCVGCCWALMASLFALGVMSITWMALVAGLIAIEKTVPWHRLATRGTAAVLLCLGLVMLIAPGSTPFLTTPKPMGSMEPPKSASSPSTAAHR